MKVGPKFTAFNISAKGLSINKKKMDLIAENIANTSTTRTSEGTPYQRKFLRVSQKDQFVNSQISVPSLKMEVSNPDHISGGVNGLPNMNDGNNGITMEVNQDASEGDKVYMPDHPDADDEGYVLMPNVNVVTEMVDMIAATRSYEANLTAFNASKQIAKDSLEI